MDVSVECEANKHRITVSMEIAEGSHFGFTRWYDLQAVRPFVDDGVLLDYDFGEMGFTINGKNLTGNGFLLLKEFNEWGEINEAFDRTVMSLLDFTYKI